MYTLMHNDFVVAAGAAGFWNSTLGGWVKGILGALGVLIVLGAVIMAAGKFMKGDIGKGLKGLLGALLIAAFCFAPQQISTQLINLTVDIINLFTQSVNDVAPTKGGGAKQ